MGTLTPLCGRDAGCPHSRQESPSFGRGPGAPQAVSLLTGAKSDRGHGALLGPRGHAAPRPRGPQHFLRYLVIHDPHEHGLGCGRRVPRRGSRGSCYTPARNSLFSWKRRTEVGVLVVAISDQWKVLTSEHLFPRRVPVSPHPPFWVQKKQHFISDPGLAVQTASGPGTCRPFLVSAIPGSALPRCSGTRRVTSRGSRVSHFVGKRPGAPQAAGGVRGTRSSQGLWGSHPGGRFIQAFLLPPVHAARPC